MAQCLPGEVDVFLEPLLACSLEVCMLEDWFVQLHLGFHQKYYLDASSFTVFMLCDLIPHFAWTAGLLHVRLVLILL